ncbi:MAG: vitamin B12-dependent ribonucleotide reductase [Flavobacteriaceae bacterium]|nr:vitamin B12-dependent ribonucleotide reductase [Flavobacteriaceae bacterium]
MAKNQGLKFQRQFTKTGISVYDQFQYDLRQSVIKNPAGDYVFKMDNVEVPTGWSQVATDILAQKYFRKAGVPQADGSMDGETSLKQVAHRMADCWKQWGEKYGYFNSEGDATVFYEELVYSLMSQQAAPNSPQWFNTGLHSAYGIAGKPQGHYYVDPETEKLNRSTSAYERPQPHACFILSVDDDLVNEGGIMDLWVREARIFKYGSGVGTNYSRIRGEGEKLSGGGTSSGLMSFLKIGDRAAGAIKSGGTTRRAAKMVCLDLDHPEAINFIDWKVKEEQKVAALIAAGYDSGYEGEAYATVSGQNSNNSVRIPDSFFEALDKGENWQLKARSTGEVMKEFPAKEVWNKINHAAWACADPGVQYDTTINDWHTCPEGGLINASNPCSEYMFLDNTACNLASFNLMKFFDTETLEFDVEGFEYATRLWTTVLEISVTMAQFPSKEVAQLSYEYRTLGLGYANMGTMLMVSGIPYDSPKATAIIGAITAIMTGRSYETSSEMAKYLGAFVKFPENKKNMMRVMRNHRYAAYNSPKENYEALHITPVGIDPKYCPDYLLKAACDAWDDAVQMGDRYGYRNAQATVIAPTGTIGLVMDCDTTGIEPDFALVKFKKLSGGGYFKIINQAVPAALKTLGYTEEESKAIITYATGTNTLMCESPINFESLLARGLTKEDLEKVEAQLMGAFEIGFAFNQWTFGEEAMLRLGFKVEDYNDKNFNMLRALRFTREEIEQANAIICGTGTTEDAPYLKEEHYPVFDCANRCGSIGQRFIHAHAHIQAMAAAQPFISGAISKTINLPNEATEADIASCYRMSWELGLKANALYRDGCKLSQPLSNKSDVKDEDKIESVEQVVGELGNLDVTKLPYEKVIEAVQDILNKASDRKFAQDLATRIEKQRLPNKRRGFTQKAKIGGQVVFVRTGEYSDGSLGEIFIDMHKEGATFRSIINCFAIAVSIGLQHGVPLEEYVGKFTFTRFEPSGFVQGHENIKSATSIIDYIFRLLGYEYLNRNDLVQVQPTAEQMALKQQEYFGHEEAIDTFDAELASPLIGDNLTPIGFQLSGISGTATAPSPVMEAPVASPKTKNMAVEPKMHYTKSAPKAKPSSSDYLKNMQSDAPACTECGHITVRSGTCYKCLNCGTSLGCS